MALSGPLMAYINRGNTEKLELIQDNQRVTANAVTRAVFRFGVYCLDTEVDNAELIELIDNAQVLRLRLGLVPNLIAGTYKKGTLTLYDELTEHGKAWIRADVRAELWPVCET